MIRAREKTNRGGGWVGGGLIFRQDGKMSLHWEGDFSIKSWRSMKISGEEFSRQTELQVQRPCGESVPGIWRPVWLKQSEKGESGRSLGEINIGSSINIEIMQDLIGHYKMLAFTLSELRSQRRVSEQRSEKIWLPLATILRTGYRDKRAETETKKEMIVPWTRVGMGQREKEAVTSKTYVKGRGDQIWMDWTWNMIDRGQGLQIFCPEQREGWCVNSLQKWPQSFPPGMHTPCKVTL